MYHNKQKNVPGPGEEEGFSRGCGTAWGLRKWDRRHGAVKTSYRNVFQALHGFAEAAIKNLSFAITDFACQRPKTA